MSHHFSQRLDRLRPHLPQGSAFLLSSPTDITYFTGFPFLVPEEREAFLLVTHEHSYLIHTSFTEFAAQAWITPKSGCFPDRLAQYLQEITHSDYFSSLLIDEESLFVHEFNAIKKVSQLKIDALDKKAVWSVRIIKDTGEQELIKRASRIVAESVSAVQDYLKVGITELELKEALESEMKQRGSDRPAFPTIVCFGPHGALPHHQPTATPLTEETAILIDAGATVEGYRSDMTRSWWFGSQPSKDYQEVETIIHQAYQDALSALMTQTASAQTVDEAARQTISNAGYGQYFIHTTGHGVGLDIHEPPSLHWRNDYPLKPNMVITIEPGIYLPNQFGYRYENTVLLTKSGYQELTLT